ncbi:MAG: tetratricopeptide repeat protein [Acidobacteriota bacterium]
MSERTYPASPYKGLAAYSEEDAPFFFGREEERRNIISNLTASRLTLLYGASGVGKSSVLRAGVVPDLRRLARKNSDESGSPEFAVAVFNTWRDDPVGRLTACVRESVIKTLDDQTVDQVPPPSSLVDTFRAWTKLVGGTLLVILDQFEDFFLYHRNEKGEGSFATEFSRLVNCRDLRVNFLISVRDDTYSRLDFLEKDIPGLFDNFLRIPYLDREATRAAIIKPIEQYNRFYGAGRKRISIESELVEEVLKGPSKAKALHSDQEQAGVANAGAIIETPFLQLVMTSLWKEEMRLGSTTLRLETLNRLGGVDSIVETHLSEAMKKLSRKERAIAASVFHYLVTPSGHKMAYAVSDLAKQAQLDQRETTELLEKLARGDNRILRPFALPERQDEQFYEISLDVLATPILDWRTRAEEKARFAVRLRILTLALIVMSLLTAAGFVYARTERALRREEEAKLRAVKASNVSSQVLAQLYKVLVGSEDPDVARKNAKETLGKLNEARETYRIDGSRTGEGIALNNLAGFYRLLGGSYAAIEDFKQAESNYQQAQENYQQALEILTDALGPDHTEVATSLTGSAVVYTYQGKYAEAEPLLEQSLMILINALGSDDRYLADAIMNLAECYESQGKYYQAEPRYKRALEIRRNKLGENHTELAESLYQLAGLYFERGKYAEAEPLFKQALAIWERDKSDIRDAATSLDALSALYREKGNLAEAERYLNLAWEIHKDFIERDKFSVAYHFENVGLLYDAQDNPNAETAYNAAVVIWTRALGKNHPTRAFGLSKLASYCYKHGRFSDAERLFSEALTIQQALPDSPELAQTSYGLARIYTDQLKYVEAEPLFKQALAIQEKAIPEHPDFAATLDAYADLLSKTERNAAADVLRNRAEQIRQNHLKANPR